MKERASKAQEWMHLSPLLVGVEPLPGGSVSKKRVNIVQTNFKIQQDLRQMNRGSDIEKWECIRAPDKSKFELSLLALSKRIKVR